MSATLLLRLILWSWIAAAVYAGHVRLLQRFHPAALPAIVLLITTVVVMAYFRLGTLRAWVDALDLRRIVALHIVRFAGIAFLVLHHRGKLPYGFAVPAGIGDIVIATLALPVVFAPLNHEARQRAVSIWNIAAVADLLLVLATATRINLADPDSLYALTELPLSLVPTFLMPLLLATHVIIFIRLGRPASAS